MKNIDARSLSTEAKEALRKRIIISIFEKGMTQAEAARVFDVSTRIITKWVKVYRAKGLKGLDKKKQGRPKSGGQLEGWQASLIVRIIKEKCPDQLKMPFVLWTRDAVQLLIKEKFNINYSRSTISRLLKRWGFTPQKPIKRAYERNDKKILYWMQTEYPKIKLQAKTENAEIHWGDEMGIKSTDQVGRSFSPKGKTPVIKKTIKRFKCNMISSISNNGRCRFMIFEDSFTIEIFLKFLRKLIKNNNRKIFLIVDNHKVHHSKKVGEWLNKHKDKVSIFFLPAYAPELNPDELLNQDVKASFSKKYKAKNTIELKKYMLSYLLSLQKSSQKIQNFFNKKEVQYAA